MVSLRGLQPGDLGWVVQRHGELYAREYGWGQRFEGLVARIVGAYAESFDAAKESAWVAESNGARVGSVFCVRKDAQTAQLRLLFTDPQARGIGVGTRLVTACIDFARRAGYEELILWTHQPLHAARRIYDRAGFVLVKEERHDEFGEGLIGQSLSLKL